MKGVVVYFSQTGNTRKIARAIQTGIKQVMVECDITKLKEANIQDLTQYDLIGLGSPIWRLGVPVHVLAFINGLPSLEGKHVFPFCTHGALPVGFMQKIVPALKRKGLTVIGYNDWYGGCFLPYLPKPYVTDGHPDEIDLKEAEDFGREMAELSQRIYLGETELIPKLPKGREWHKIYGTPPLKTASEFVIIRKIVQGQMRINMEKCRYPTCTLCVDHCPMNSIDFSVSPPVFKDNCVTDWFCEQICPEGAIEVNYSLIIGPHDRVVRERYIRLTAEAEAKGRFRRLVPLDEIGWDTHQYEIPGHPRLVPE